MAIAALFSADPLQTPVVILIDEVELHLRPGLQRTITPSLRRVFPYAQIIASTHSSQFLSSVHASSIRVVENIVVRSIDRETWRRDANRIFEVAFSDPERPPECARRL
ncbi:MAG: AAA family ATPase, partial [Deltaproteobacteria bacterium]